MYHHGDSIPCVLLDQWVTYRSSWVSFQENHSKQNQTFVNVVKKDIKLVMYVYICR